jgi:hypothetical protein
MDRSYLTHPGLVRAGWEGLVLYPVLFALSEDMRLGGDVVDPVYLSVVTRIPVSVLTEGMTSLGVVGILVEQDGSYLLTDCSSRERMRVHAPPPGRGRALESRRAFSRPGAGPPSRGLAHEGLEPYLVETWGELISRGKPLSAWVVGQTDAHPEMDLLGEAKKAHAWDLGQKKSKTSIRRFLGNWFNRAEGFKEEGELRAKIQAEGGLSHWSGLNKRDRDAAIRSGHHDHFTLVNKVSLIRDLRDEMFVLSGQDLTHTDLPYKVEVKAAIQGRLEASEDPHLPEPIVDLLKNMGARPESSRALQWAMDQLVTDVRYDMGLLPV